MAKFRDKEKQKKIAEERIKILFSEAKDIFPTNPKRANRYVEMARKVAMKVNLEMTKLQKRQFCKHCYSYLRSGVNATSRTRDAKLIIYCKECKKYTRIPLTKKSTKE